LAAKLASGLLTQSHQLQAQQQLHQHQQQQQQQQLSQAASSVGAHHVEGNLPVAGSNAVSAAAAAPFSLDLGVVRNRHHFDLADAAIDPRASFNVYVFLSLSLTLDLAVTW
jgi:hypothetical protein